MKYDHDEKPAQLSPKGAVWELLAGYAMIFAVFGVMFGYATGIGVTYPVDVLAGIAGLLVILLLAARKGR